MNVSMNLGFTIKDILKWPVTYMAKDCCSEEHSEELLIFHSHANCKRAENSNGVILLTG
jgi:hypothetical protein